MARSKGKGINLSEESDSEFMKNRLQRQLQQMDNAEFDEFMKVARYERSENRHNCRNGSYARMKHRCCVWQPLFGWNNLRHSKLACDIGIGA